MNNISFFIHAIVAGFGWGFVAAIPLGPSGMESIKRSLSHGFREGFKVSVGAIIADYFYVLLINLGFSALLSANKKLEGLFWIISGIILILFNKMSHKSDHPIVDRLTNHKYSGMLNGFLVTFLNPMTPSMWLVLSGTLMTTWRTNGYLFYVIALCSMMIGGLCWFAILNVLASKGIKILKDDISEKTSIIMKYIMLALGVGFIAYGTFSLLFQGW
ncbi:Threonine/homoserine/homoserine lactone efflux protein [Clostridium cavendishii DSM 21758]|uniref:Threonine/homoserine/homoserine lactone efflux protein n=1 Tax=Clostridium cavendishii DSM 21758 TaxID=1121302 RepID=A0A1M6TJV5_9CLOT|nr:LysE family transporter [Clostridium cavendishii]SHK57193.1 Threonine/homoserine/homoserine lactone efflux protein [Clostridium cavendishii DSM 21758]